MPVLSLLGEALYGAVNVCARCLHASYSTLGRGQTRTFFEYPIALNLLNDQVEEEECIDHSRHHRLKSQGITNMLRREFVDNN